jgi:hypothetical protein
MILAVTEKSVYRSPELEAIQARADAPFGMLFLSIYVTPLDMGKIVSTQTNEETSNDGKSKLAMTQSYRLNYAGIDLLYTLDGKYVFLELNPVGQLGWLVEHTGLPLFRSLAHFLIDNHT